MVAYDIREGEYGDALLDGFSVIAVLQFDGNFWTGEVDVTFCIFINERDERQREAIQMVFSGGVMAMIADLMGDGGRWIDSYPLPLNWPMASPHNASWCSCPTPQSTGF